jgi:hypothetical protein
MAYIFASETSSPTANRVLFECGRGGGEVSLCFVNLALIWLLVVTNLFESSSPAEADRQFNRAESSSNDSILPIG